MIAPPLGRNTTQQLNMGEGKSSVIVPIVVCALADGHKLVRVVVLKALSAQMFHLLVARIGGLVNRRVFFLPFSRQIDLTYGCLHDLEELYHQCAREGGVMLVQPEHILSLKLMTINTRISMTDSDEDSLLNADVAVDLERIHSWISTSSRDVLDESDELLHVQYQLIYTSGAQQSLDDAPDRWTTTQQLLDIVSRVFRALYTSHPDVVEYRERGPGAFPHIRLLNTSDTPRIAQNLTEMVAKSILGGEMQNLNLGEIGSIDDQDLVVHFLTKREISHSAVARVEQLCRGTWKGVLLARGLLAFDVLRHILTEKRYRVNYGLDLKRSLLAVPYAAKVSACTRGIIFVLTPLIGRTNLAIRVQSSGGGGCTNSAQLLQRGLGPRSTPQLF
jgi:hypothetical protein